MSVMTDQPEYGAGGHRLPRSLHVSQHAISRFRDRFRDEARRDDARRQMADVAGQITREVYSAFREGRVAKNAPRFLNDVKSLGPNPGGKRSFRSRDGKRANVRMPSCWFVWTGDESRAYVVRKDGNRHTVLTVLSPGRAA